MKTILLLIYSFVLFVALVHVIFGYSLWWIVVGIALFTFWFVDWENMPWIKLRWKY